MLCAGTYERLVSTGRATGGRRCAGAEGKRHIPRVEAAHVVVALHAGVDDATGLLLLHDATGIGLVDPVREAPHGRGDALELDAAAGDAGEGRDEVRIPSLVVEEDDGIVEPAVELVLKRLDGAHGALELAVAREHDDGGILARRVHVGFATARGKGRVERDGRARNVEALDV